jgi:transposase
MTPVVEAYQAMRGVAFLTAVTFVAEIGDVRRFETPRQLMAYLGLVTRNARPASRYDAVASPRPATQEPAVS